MPRTAAGPTGASIDFERRGIDCALERCHLRESTGRGRYRVEGGRRPGVEIYTTRTHAAMRRPPWRTLARILAALLREGREARGLGAREPRSRVR